jgi:diaminopimelate decarboxylase
MNLPGSIADYWKSAHNELLVGGLSISSIVARHGTPIFVYDLEVLERKYTALRNTLPQKFQICYSVKANPNPAFLRFFLEKGCGLEIASAGEFHLALHAGCVPEEIVFAGPGKTASELETVIADRIGEIHAESALEVDRISTISSRLGVRTRVAIRVNPNEESQGGAMQMGGRSAPFGVDEENLEPLLRRVVSDAHLNFSGIHLFAGTQILDHRLLLTQYRKGLEIASRAVGCVGAPLHTLDFGGGLGIPYLPDDQELDLPELANGLAELLADKEKESTFERTRFIVEPGRFLVGESGVYVARINDIKESRGKKYLILDGGMNHHLAASGNLGQVIKRNFPIAILNKLQATETETVDVVGPLCTPLDTLGRSVRLPRAEVGDLIGILQSGAYTRSASPLGFLSHPTPAEVWVENGQDLLIRRRGRVEDSLRDILPNFLTAHPIREVPG